MNNVIRECVECEHLEIVSGGGWCHKDEICNKVPQKPKDIILSLFDSIKIVDDFMENECFGVPECEAWERIKNALEEL